jgi:4-hydroxy-tetrahydrodipicolinate synthase
MQLIFEEGNPAGIKSVFESLGLCGSTVRLPLVDATASLKTRIGTFLRAMDTAHA